jgi:O-antigen/teichoic acid export membrane protein
VVSENKNFLMNVAYQLLSYVFPLVTVSYVSQCLGVTNIGTYSYTYSTVYLFMLLGMLGINNYGNREIARVRDDKQACSFIFFSIYKLQLLTVGLASIGYVIYIQCIVSEYEKLFWLQAIYLFSAFLDVNWFYFGLEKFKLTITRNCIIKVASLILILFFVRTEADLAQYTVIMAGSTFLSQLYLILILHRYIVNVHTTLHDSLHHLRGCCILFIPVLAFGIYRVMDKTMLGAMATVTELGYYENAERLINIPISIINALGTVMLPRMSYLLKNHSVESTKAIYASMKLALLLSCMMAAGIFLVSNDIVVVLFGYDFYKSGEIIRILSITILASAWANVIRTQYLIPSGKDTIYVISTIGGAVVNLLLNIVLIPKYGAYGACLGTIAAEYFVMIYQTVKVRRVLEIKRYFNLAWKDLVISCGIILFSYEVGNFFSDIYVRLLVNIFIAIVLFGTINYKYIVHEFLGKR